jgi:hypothetical protein
VKSTGGSQRSDGIKTNGGFYYVPGPDCDRLMIPTKYLNELKNAPDDHADFLGSFTEVRLEVNTRSYREYLPGSS